MTHKTFLAIAGAAAISLLAAESAAQSLTLIGPGVAEGVSADGTTVVGWDFESWTWNAGGGVTTMVGGSFAVACSADGSVVLGERDEPSLLVKNMATWSATGGWTDLLGLPTWGACGLSSASEISDDGLRAVGLGWDDCTGRAAQWTAATGLQMLPQIGPKNSRANALSGDGQWIGGWDENSFGSRRAAVWHTSGAEVLVLVDPVLNPEGLGECYGVSTDGSFAVGGGDTGGHGAWRWSPVSGVLYLPAPLGYPAGSNTIKAVAVSDDGKTIVGTASSGPFGGQTAWIWTESGGTQLLSDAAAAHGLTFPAGSTFLEANDLTPDGHTIVGAAGDLFALTAFTLYLPDCGWETYGEGASHANLLDLAGGGGTGVGDAFLLTTTNLVAPVCITGAALGSASFPLFGGVALIDPATLFKPFTAATVAGTATLSIPIPANPIMAGVEVFFQSLAQDGGQPDGWAFSNGVKLKICP